MGAVIFSLSSVGGTFSPGDLLTKTIFTSDHFLCILPSPPSNHPTYTHILTQEVFIEGRQQRFGRDRFPHAIHQSQAEPLLWSSAFVILVVEEVERKVVGKGGGVRTVVQHDGVGDHGVRGHELVGLDAVGLLQHLNRVAVNVLSARPAD